MWHTPTKISKEYSPPALSGSKCRFINFLKSLQQENNLSGSLEVGGTSNLFNLDTFTLFIVLRPHMVYIIL